VGGGVTLGLLNLVLDGQGQHPGVRALGDNALKATLHATDVTLQRCHITIASSQPGDPYGGAAIRADNGNLVFTRAEMLSNVCDDNFGGAIVLRASTAEEVGVSVPCVVSLKA